MGLKLQIKFTHYIYIMNLVCNITGINFNLNDEEKDREMGSRFGFNCRFRAICYVFSKIFYGECKIMNDLKENKSLKGIGMSDSGWAKIFEQKFNYTNTYYHTSPYLDIYNDIHVNNYQELDFIISSDVFEHIDPYPDIQIAFNNLNKMLKKNGFIIFSVPYTNGKHIEHFPLLYEYKILKGNDGEYYLYNKTIDGKKEIHENLCFHGGPGNVLEMRIFSRDSITNYLEKAGFTDIIFYNITDEMNNYGIFWSKDNNDANSNCSLIISAKKI